MSKGSAPAHSLSIDENTNRINMVGFTYDANGNMTTMPNAGAPATTMAYDIANRMVESVHNTAGTYRYGYNHANQRVFQHTSSTAFGTLNRRFSLYRFGGELLLEAIRTGTGVQPHTGEVVRYVYFLGRKMFASVNRGPLRAAVPNRLGSRSEHFPYGELKGAAPPEGDKDHFTTYRRDETGLDYAWNRYYAPSVGRFTTADPYGGSINAGDPQSWNRYAYADNEPIGRVDPTGMMWDSLMHPGDGPGGGGGGWHYGIPSGPSWGFTFGFSIWREPAWCLLPLIGVLALDQEEPVVECNVQLTSWLIEGPINLTGEYRHLAVVFSKRAGSSDGSVELLQRTTYDAGADFAVYLGVGGPGIGSIGPGLSLRVGLLLGVTITNLDKVSQGRHGTAVPDPLGRLTNIQSETGWSSSHCAFGPALETAAKRISSGSYAYRGLTSNSNTFASTLLSMVGLPLSIKPGTDRQHPGWGHTLHPILGVLHVLTRFPADNAIHPSN